MKLHLSKLAQSATIAAALVAVPNLTHAQEVLRFAHVYETDHPLHKGALMAAEEFKKRTDGRYEIEVFPSSSLGKEEDINEGLTLGTVDIIYTGAGFAGTTYGPISITDFPFTLRDLDHWKAYRDSDLFQELAQGYSEVTGGNQIGAISYYGTRHVTSNVPITKPEDMKGLKIRVPSAKAYVLFPQEVGANPVPLAFSEVYLALQQGVVDAEENPLPTIKAKKFYEVQSNINLTGHITNSTFTVVSGPRLAQMEAEDRQILFDVLKESADSVTGEIVQAEEDLIPWFRDQGVTINEVDRGPFIEAVRPALVSDDMPFSKEIYDRLQAIK